MRLKIAVSVVRFRPWAPLKINEFSGFLSHPSKSGRPLQARIRSAFD
jgi:hypothetical protein